MFEPCVRIYNDFEDAYISSNIREHISPSQAGKTSDALIFIILSFHNFFKIRAVKKSIFNKPSYPVWLTQAFINEKFRR